LRVLHVYPTFGESKEKGLMASCQEPLLDDAEERT
jgi:hypothetical protein